jgi:hypothetical protein
MIEKFESRRMNGTINVACKFQGGTKYWRADKRETVGHIIRIVEHYASIGYRLTLRQLHYQFVGHVPGYINHQMAYKKLGKILDDCRYAGLIDWDQIVDRTREPQSNYTVEGIPDALQKTVDHYTLDRQKHQNIHVEVWTEKDALSEIFWRSASKYGLTLSINKGNISTSAIHNAYERFIERVQNNQEVKILYFGDHDPSGLDMVRDIDERLHFMFENGNHADIWASDYFELIPIGLNKQQIKKYKLPPNPVKLTDSRTPGYIEKHGQNCWEVDALAPNVLTSILETNILKHIDADLYGEQLVQEQKDKQKLTGLIKKFKR